MKRIFYMAFVVGSLLLLTSLSIAQELGGAAGANNNNSGDKANYATMTDANKVFSSNNILLTIDVGSPEIGAEEGIFIWCDENQTWQVRWKGEPGQLVWVRLKAKNYITDIMPMGERITTEMRSKMTLTITGTTTTELTGVSFRCETPEIDIDAKWNMARVTNKVYISGQKKNLRKLPNGVKVPIFAEVNQDVNSMNVRENVTEHTNSSFPKGRTAK